MLLNIPTKIMSLSFLHYTNELNTDTSNLSMAIDICLLQYQ